jgi:formylmethanofuran dehydrogenase subunit E
MHHPNTSTKARSAEAERPISARCEQCGEGVDAQRLRKLARVDHVLCADCAYDAIPCTD